MAIEVVTLGHVLYDIRCYVQDFPQPDKTVILQRPIRTGCGGSAANTAVDCVRLGHRAGLVGNLAFDRHGQFLLEDLEKSGVDTTEVRLFRKGESGSCIVLIDRNAEVEVIENIGVMDEYRSVSPVYIQQAKHLHMTGINPKILAECAGIAKRSGVTVSFDPGRSKSQLGIGGLKGILRNCDYLIINRKELGLLTGMPGLTGVNKLQKLFGLTMVIKGGKKPVYARSKEEKILMKPFAAKPVDTIGAGDAFAAGFITALLEGEKLKGCVRWANAAAAAKVMHMGAQGLPSREWVEEQFLGK